MISSVVFRAQEHMATVERRRDIVMIQLEDAQTLVAITRSQARSGKKPPEALASQLKLGESRLAETQKRQRQVNVQLVEAQLLLEQAYHMTDNPAADPPQPTSRPRPRERTTRPEPERKTRLKTRPEPRPKTAKRPARDADGYQLKPDPLHVASAAELVDALIAWRVWAGDLSFRKMEERSGRRASAASICTALSKRKLPSLEVVMAVVEGCGGSAQDLGEWATGWRLIRTGRRAPHVETPLRAVPDAPV